MAEWVYDLEDWKRTREVTLAQDGDGLWRWRRVRTGPEGKTVSACVSGGFDDPKWAYRNAVKENLGLTVTPPEGVEEFIPTPEDDEVEEPATPPQPEA